MVATIDVSTVVRRQRGDTSVAPQPDVSLHEPRPSVSVRESEQPSNIMLLVQRQTTDGTVDAMTAANDDGSQLRDEIATTANSSIPYESVRSGEGACRPLSFPAPVIDGAVSVSADVVDHSTGDSVRYLLGRHELHTRSRDLPFSLSANPGTR